MNNKTSKLRSTILGIFGIFLLFFSIHSAAAPPPDNWYAGGPDGFGAAVSLSETWHMIDEDDDDEHVKLFGKKVTLRRHGPQWFLIPATDLDWKPATIKLEDHPDFIPWGGANQWRWVSKPAVRIEDEDGDRHRHDVCVGFPTEAARRDNDEIHIAVVDQGESCGDPSEDHPGHSGAGR